MANTTRLRKRNRSEVRPGSDTSSRVDIPLEKERNYGFVAISFDERFSIVYAEIRHSPHTNITATNVRLRENAKLRYNCDALTDCLVMLGYKCPTTRRNKSGYRETKTDTEVCSC